VHDELTDCAEILAQFERDIPVRFFDTGHFALETHVAERLISQWRTNVA
jgi:hypothetical protein